MGVLKVTWSNSRPALTPAGEVTDEAITEFSPNRQLSFQRELYILIFSCEQINDFF